MQHVEKMLKIFSKWNTSFSLHHETRVLLQSNKTLFLFRFASTSHELYSLFSVRTLSSSSSPLWYSWFSTAWWRAWEVVLVNGFSSGRGGSGLRYMELRKVRWNPVSSLSLYSGGWQPVYLYFFYLSVYQL